MIQLIAVKMQFDVFKILDEFKYLLYCSQFKPKKPISNLILKFMIQLKDIFNGTQIFQKLKKVLLFTILMVGTNAIGQISKVGLFRL